MRNKLNHIGFIMDGNGRWANKLNKNRTYGHSIGAKKIKEVVSWCIENKIKTISLYAFSVENWKRPKTEVNFLMNLLLNHITQLSIKELNEKGIKIIWSGFENDIDINIINALRLIEKETQNNQVITINILFNYGSQQKIISTINDLIYNNKLINIENFNNAIDPHNLGPLDLIIRTSGEQRLSNFMLWEASYAELVFTKLHWPEYDKNEFLKNIDEYYQRKRKFGTIK